MKRFCLAALLGSVALSGAAFAQSDTNVGSVTVTGETGQVIVQRGTETYSLGPDDQIFIGDKIVTRVGGTVDITAFGCTVSVPAEATITIGASFCDTVPVTVASNTPPASVAGSVEAAGGSGAGGLGGLAGLGALAAVGGVAILASGGGDDDDTPASP